MIGRMSYLTSKGAYWLSLNRSQNSLRMDRTRLFSRLHISCKVMKIPGWLLTGCSQTSCGTDLTMPGVGTS
jgi:hypothetical protein